MRPELLTKPLCEFTPDEYHEYIRSLYYVPPKPDPVELTVGLSPKGKLKIANRRKPQWILTSEIAQIAADQNIPHAEVLAYVTQRGFQVFENRETALAQAVPETQSQSSRKNTTRRTGDADAPETYEVN